MVCDHVKEDSSSGSVDKNPHTSTEEVKISNDFHRRPIARRRRTLPPFIPMYDVARGVLYSLNSLLGYILMLSVMSVPLRFC